MSEATEPPRWVWSSASPSVERRGAAHGVARSTTSRSSGRKPGSIVCGSGTHGRAGRRRPPGRTAAPDGRTARDDVVVGAVADRDRMPVEAGDVQLEAFHDGHETGEGDDRGRARGRAPAEAERPAHHRPLREAAQHQGRRQLIEQPDSSSKLGQNVSWSGVGMPASRTSARLPVAARAVRAASGRAAAVPDRARRAEGRGRVRRRRGRGGGRELPAGSPAAGRWRRTRSATRRVDREAASARARSGHEDARTQAAATAARPGARRPRRPRNRGRGSRSRTARRPARGSRPT